MVKPSYLYRNARSGELLELFLIAGVSTLLLNRAFLALAGYPSIGGSHLHIAHVLWGGAFMVAAQIIMAAFIGHRAKRLASVVGGIGFGLFIDELGKFITRDNNYFFQPAIALIYLVFVGLFVLIRSLSRQRLLTPQESLLNALGMTEEMVIADLDSGERARALWYLRSSDPDDPLAVALRKMLIDLGELPHETQSWIYRWVKGVENFYEKVVTTRLGTTAIDLVFLGKATIFLVSIAIDIYGLLIGHTTHDLVYVSFLEFASSATSAGFVIAGVRHLRSSRWQAYDYFAKSLLIDLLMTQFFAFYRHQLGALPGFIATLAVYIALRLLIRQERRIRLVHSDLEAAVID